MLIECDLATVSGEVQRGVRLTIFTVAIGKLANEVGFISSLCPSLTQVETYGTRRPTNLPCKRRSLFRWEALAHPSKTFLASSYAFLYTSKSLAQLIRIRDSDQAGARIYDIRSSRSLTSDL